MKDLPNIVLVVLDATRVDRISAYGSKRVATPNIDLIANEGVLFERAFSPSTWTLPVISSIFTGLPSYKHDVTWIHPRLSLESPTLAEHLSFRGYQTWGISPGAWVGHVTGLDRGFDEFREIYKLVNRRSNFSGVHYINRFYTKYIFRRRDKGSRRINNMVKKWLRLWKGTSDGRPFFMFLHYMEPHYPYKPPSPFKQLYFPDQNTLNKAQRIKHNPLDYFAGRLTLTEEEFELLSKLYDGEIAYLDAQIGELRHLLQSRDLLDSTIIVLFADHGENLGDHGLLDHHFCLYDTLIHVPLIIRYPPLFPGSSRVPDLVETRDIFYTILDLANTQEAESEVQKHSLRLDQLRKHPREYLISYCSGSFARAIEKRRPVRDITRYAQSLKAIRTSRYKYIEGSRGHVELFDLKIDPSEQENIANRRSDLVEGFQEILVDIHAEEATGSAWGHPKNVIEDPTVMERLRSLGYVD